MCVTWMHVFSILPQGERRWNFITNQRFSCLDYDLTLTFLIFAVLHPISPQWGNHGVCWIVEKNESFNFTDSERLSWLLQNVFMTPMTQEHIEMPKAWLITNPKRKEVLMWWHVLICILVMNTVQIDHFSKMSINKIFKYVTYHVYIHVILL